MHCLTLFDLVDHIPLNRMRIVEYLLEVRLPTGKLATTDKENAEVLGPHFEKVFNNHRPIEWKVINEIKQHQTMHELNEPISWAELKTAIAKLANDKAPSINKVPPNAFKSLRNALFLNKKINYVISTICTLLKWQYCHHLGIIIPY